MPPKLTVEELAPSVPGVCPLPESAMASEAFEASLVTFSVAVLFPPDEGEKTTLKFVLCPGARDNGKLNPDTLKPAPETDACETVTVEPPELVSVSGWDWLVPTGTLPKLNVDDPAARVPAITALAESAISRLALVALLEIAM